MKAKKVGIMGGTFNPIHIGHLLIAEAARDYFELDSVLFMPSGHSYMKAGSEILEARIRLEMTVLGIEDNPYFEISDMEIRRKGNTYTYETIALLKAENPDTEYYFIIGADTLFSMETWVAPEKIFRECILAAAVRDQQTAEAMQQQIDRLSLEYGADIRLLPVKPVEVSSTDIRQKLKNGHSIRYLVPDKVREYILAHKKYM